MFKRPHLTSQVIQHDGSSNVARDVTGDQNATLGDLVKRNPGVVAIAFGQSVPENLYTASDQARQFAKGKHQIFEKLNSLWDWPEVLQRI